jgi:ketosteroid isomerase-like protein
MSETNVELVRRAWLAFNNRDFPAMERIYSEDVVFRLIGGFADLMGTEFLNRDAVLDWIRDWIETIDPRAQIEMIRPVDDRVFAIVNFAATGAASGVATTLRSGVVYSVRDGHIHAQDAYYEVNDAFQALGLEE